MLSYNLQTTTKSKTYYNRHRYHHTGFPYSAFVWFFPRMPAHMHHQHVLRLERLLCPRAAVPPTDKRLLIRMYVIVVDVLYEIILGGEFYSAVFPVTVCLDEISRFVFEIRRVALYIRVHALPSDWIRRWFFFYSWLPGCDCIIGGR